MARQNVKFLSAVASILAIGILVSGCGRRGSLELPPSATVVTTDEQGNAVTKPAPKPDKPFVLDGLI
jgi:predicted small lipoprotein YifL